MIPDLITTSLEVSRKLKKLGFYDYNSIWHWIEDDNGWSLIGPDRWEWSCDTMSHFNCCSAFTVEELAKIIIEKESN